jgi:hypothetical protein
LFVILFIILDTIGAHRGAYRCLLLFPARV